MSKESDTRAVDEFELEHFEKNRYFQGKLMTAHDMSTEQEYHASRLETINRLVGGTGIVSGLAITEFESTDGELRVTIAPGVAIDREGRPIVVRTPTTRTIPTGDSDHVYLYLTYGEEPKDPVPVPGVEATNGGESEESRILEIFELVAKETPPSTTKVPPIIEFPDLESTGEYADFADRIIDSYRHARRERTEPGSDNGIFLGAFERLPEGDWEINDEETRRRPVVYNNDMLFSLLVSQLVNGDGMQTAEEGTSTDFLESELDQISEFADQLQELEIEIAQLRDEIQNKSKSIRSDLTLKIETVEDDLQAEIETTESELGTRIDETEQELTGEIEQLQDALRTQAELNAYQSLKTAIQSYDSTADAFEHHGQVSKQALGLTETIQQGLADQVDRDVDQYRAFVARVTEEIEQFVETLDGKATKESYSQFVDTVDRLQETQADDSTFIHLVTAFDRVSQTARLLKPRYEIHPE